MSFLITAKTEEGITVDTEARAISLCRNILRGPVPNGTTLKITPTGGAKYKYMKFIKSNKVGIISLRKE
jgi:hypothetical protein